MALLTRLHNVWRRPALEREFEDELRFHFEMRVERNVRRGMDRRDAEAEARRHMGSALRAREGMHDARMVPWLESTGRDFAYGARTLWRLPGLTAVAVLTMALGIGANAAIYSVLQAVWIDAVPFVNASKLVVLQQYFRSWHEFEELRAASRSVADMVPFQRRAEFLHDYGGGRVVGAVGTTDALFPLLGVTPLHGRALTAEDLRAGAPEVALLSHAFWQDNHGGDTEIIGRTIRLRAVGGLVGVTRPDRLITVIGVMPPDAKLLSFEPALWLPVPLADRDSNDGRFVDEIVARLRPGVSIAAAREEIAAITGRLEAGRRPVEGRRLVPLRDQVVGVGIGQSLFLLLAATGIVLLIACANVANLFLARGLDRSREMAVRAAIGASRARLVRQGLIESGLVAAAGCLLGVALAAATRDLLVKVMPYNVPRADAIAIDWRVLVFSAGLAASTALLTGLIPSLRSSSIRPEAILTAGGSQSRTTRRRRTGSVLVAAEVALSVIVLAAAGLLVGSFLKLTATDPGFDPTNVATFRADPANALERLSPEKAALVLDELTRTPDILAAAITGTVPFGQGGAGGSVRVPGQPEAITSALRTVSPGYFDVMGIALRAGRDFMPTDDENARPVAIVNERAARTLWPGNVAVGQQLEIGGRVPALVVGVVNDVQYIGLDKEPQVEVYAPIAQKVVPILLPMNFVVRTATAAVPLIQRIQPRIELLTGNRVTLLTALDTYVTRSVHVPRFRALLFGLLGLLVVVLAASGVFSVTAHVVAQRRREMGIRMAIGAQARQVVRLTLGQSARPVAVGVGIGWLGALATTKLVAQFLYETTPTDAVTFALVVVLVAITSLAAAWRPARRTLRIDPVEVLRLD